MRKVVVGFAVLLLVVTLLAIATGANLMSLAATGGTAVQEIEGLLCFLIAAVAFSGAAIVFAIRAFRA